MNEQTGEQMNEAMITMTIRIPRELDTALRRAGGRLGTYYTTLARQCLIAIVNPSEFGDMVLDSVRAAGAQVNPARDALLRNMKTPRPWTDNTIDAKYEVNRGTT